MARTIVGDLTKIFKISVSAVLPEHRIKLSLKYNSVKQQLSIANDNYDLQNKNVYLIGTGKAVQNMAGQIVNLLSSKIKHGIISIPVGSATSVTTHGNIFYYEGARDNLPDANAEATAIKIKDLVTKLGSNDLLLVLISGGGSALLPLPKPPITLEEKTALIKALANSGADIKELNIVRKKISDLKGGQLAIKAQPAKVISLILSDIVGDPLDLIASGPTTENTDDPLEARNLIKKYDLYDGLSESMKVVLKTVDIECQFPRDDVKNYIIGSNKISIAAALEEARRLNYLAISLSDMVTGNLKDVALEYLKLTKLFCSFKEGSILLEDFKHELQCCHIPGINTSILETVNRVALINKDLCIILGGEITVEVKGMGKGGRNQELALEFSNLINKEKHVMANFDIYLLSAGTDGIDGPTDAAGAIGYSDLINDAEKDNLNIQTYLINNDSYNFFKKFKNGMLHVITGHTNTNVMDIHIIIIKKKM